MNESSQSQALQRPSLLSEKQVGIKGSTGKHNNAHGIGTMLGNPTLCSQSNVWIYSFTWAIDGCVKCFSHVTLKKNMVEISTQFFLLREVFLIQNIWEVLAPCWFNIIYTPSLCFLPFPSVSLCFLPSKWLGPPSVREGRKKRM